MGGRRVGRPKSGQSGKPIDPAKLEPNEKEQAVINALLDHGALTLRELGKWAFPDRPAAQANSWARNSLRRPVCAGIVARLCDGAYYCPARGDAARELEKARDRIELWHAYEASNGRRGGGRKAVPRSVYQGEEDERIEGDIPPESVALWRRIKGTIRATDRASRLDAFLQYLHDHPGEALEARQEDADAYARRLSRASSR